MLADNKRNLIPEVVVNFIDTLANPHAPKFQKDLCAATLERIQEACNASLTKYYSKTPRKTR